jgi:hypothetical protein
MLRMTRVSAFGAKADMTHAENRWDNLENKHWNTMGHSTKMGHTKALKTGKFLTPPLGTGLRYEFDEAFAPHELTGQARQ